MENHEGMLITYNGEIYNFRELKKQLAVAGYQFKHQATQKWCWQHIQCGVWPPLKNLKECLR